MAGYDTLKVAVVLPRNMSFGPVNATSIDLCIRDFGRFSRYRASMGIFGEAPSVVFDDVAFFPISRKGGPERFLAALKHFDPDVLVVQQHRPTAAALARQLRIPVVLHRHGPEKASGWIRRWRVRRDYHELAGIVVPSQVVAESLLDLFTSGSPPVHVVSNGLDFNSWHPREVRDRQILFVGRLAPEKGVLEAAAATASALLKYPDWRAHFVFSDPDVHPSYAIAVQAALAPLGERATIETSVPHEIVKAAFESAAIALVPSIWSEPFGRTALEAFAGGSALITSGRGGLKEVVGDQSAGAAITVEQITRESLSSQLSLLMANEGRRRALAAAGRIRGVQLFSLAEVTRRFDDILQTLVEDYSLVV